jgi:hypothetical protein
MEIKLKSMEQKEIHITNFIIKLRLKWREPSVILSHVNIKYIVQASVTNQGV